MKLWLAAFRVQARYWRRHRLQAALCFGGIVLGVAVFCAIQMANEGALAAFRRGAAAFAGSATHRVIAPGGGGVPDALFARLAMAPGVRAAAPLLRDPLPLVAPRSVTLTALGLDPISEGAFRRFAFVSSRAAGSSRGASSGRADRSVGPAAAGKERPGELLERFLTDPTAVVISEGLARRLGVRPGDPLVGETPTGRHTFRVLAVFRPPPGQAAAFSQVVVQDVSAHQALFGEEGRLDAIRLILAPGAAPAVRALLPAGVRLERAGSRTQRVERMSRAFRLNLSALGLFALLVAMFLIYNAASFSVAQRERTLAMLRCIGATARTVFWALLAEALLVGAAGGVLGVLAGRLLGALMLRNTSATLFQVVLQVQPQPATAALDAHIWAVGLALGVGVSLLGAFVPAWSGARVSPLAAVQGARQTPPTRFALGAWALAGGAALGLALLLLALPGRSLAAGLVGATALALGMAALCPALAVAVSHASAVPLGRLLGAPGRMGARNLARSLSRTGVAAASLMIALALALAIEITVRSFKQTFELWLDQAVTADLYLSPALETGPPLGEALLARLRSLPMVADVAVLRSRRVLLAGREVLVLAVDLPAYARHSTLPTVSVPRAEAFARLGRGEVFVSETLAYPLGLHAGQRLALPTPQGPRTLRIAAVVQNYAAPQGVLYVSLRRFAELFGPAPPPRAAIWLKPGVSTRQALAALSGIPALAPFRVTPNAALRADALRVFDRTFAITDLMGTLAAFVAFMAVVSALTALLEERMRTLGYLRAIGISRRGLATALAVEAALLAGVAALASWATGLAMSWVLVFVINKRAFGWTLQFLPGQGSYLRLLALALVAGLLGSAYPIWRATRLSIAATIREE